VVLPTLGQSRCAPPRRVFPGGVREPLPSEERTLNRPN